MTRAPKNQPEGPDWPPEQTLRTLRQQLEKLHAFKGKARSDVASEETVWAQTTEGILIHGFGKGSHNTTHFYTARSAGVWNVGGVSPRQLQSNYDERIAGYEATLLSSIAELEASIPEDATRGAYDAGDEYAFYRDLKDIIARAKVSIFIVDNYMNTEFFELYVASVQPGIALRILTDEVRGNLAAVAHKYARSHNVDLRSGSDVHDRHIFIDDRCWTIGQSIKDAAKKKPTYMVELSARLVPAMRKIYDELWSRATTVVDSLKSQSTSL